MDTLVVLHFVLEPKRPVLEFLATSPPHLPRQDRLLVWAGPKEQGRLWPCRHSSNPGPEGLAQKLLFNDVDGQPDPGTDLVTTGNQRSLELGHPKSQFASQHEYGLGYSRYEKQPSGSNQTPGLNMLQTQEVFGVFKPFLDLEPGSVSRNSPGWRFEIGSQKPGVGTVFGYYRS